MVSIPTVDLFTQAAASTVSGLYEQPLSERMRTFLRLEFLYQQLCCHVEQDSEWGSRGAISSMLDIVAILGRGDVRGDVLKELERQIGVYDRYQHVAGVDEARLKRVLHNLQELRQRLFAVGPQFMQPVRDSEFLAAVKHRSAVPGGTCEFDLPEFSYWLSHNYEQRVTDIESWMKNLRPLCESIAELLWLLREGGQVSDEVAVHGSFQHGTIGDGVVGLLRVSLQAGSNLYPQISGSHHRFTIRFMEWPDAQKRPVQTRNDVRFRLTIC
ncbi:MAG: cell division protein ZapD [Gammaproteobacteria bacterium]